MVPRSGPYLVRHERHRPDHQVAAMEGSRFPPCHTCGKAVRFVLLDASVFKAHVTIESDPDFTEAASARTL